MCDGDGTLSYAGGVEDGDRTFVAPYLVRLLTTDRLSHGSERLSIAEVQSVLLGRSSQRRIRRLDDSGVATLSIELPDGWLSARHARLRRGPDGGWSISDLGSKNGTRIDGAPVQEASLRDGAIIEVGNSFLLYRNAVERSYQEPADASSDCRARQSGIDDTLHLPLARQLSRLKLVAASTVPVLIHGETGTGKELCARLVHTTSRRPGRLVAVNCGALATTILESELFGHLKGAFSGAAADKPGLVRSAHTGTLFLDEVADLPAAGQVALLRVLQEQEVTPVGSATPIRVDVRVVAASNQNLSDLADQGQFRSDLFARLCGHTIELPPLRERREDLGTLICRLLDEITDGGLADISVERDAARLLFHHSWPRNVRELRQVLAAACAIDPRCVRASALAPLLEQANAGPDRTRPQDADLRDRLLEQLVKHRGNISAVAREMDKARVQIRRWCKRFSIDPDAYRQ